MRVQLSPTTTLTEMEGKAVLFSRSTGSFHGLNASAAHLLRTLLDSDFDSTVAKCSQDYSVDAAVIAADLKELVDELVTLKLLVRS